MFNKSIRTSILTIFMSLLGIISLSLLSSQYYFNNSLALNTTQKTFGLISNNISQNIQKKNLEIVSFLKNNYLNKDFLKEIVFDYQHPVLGDLFQIMNSLPGIYSINLAHGDGSFYALLNIKSSPKLKKRLNAPKNTAWVVNIDINDTSSYSFLDKEYKLISELSTYRKYNPLERPWYTKALSSQQVTVTAPYLFTLLKEYGTTYTMQVGQKGTVIAIEYRIKTLSKIFKSQILEEDSEIFLFNKKGKQIVSSNEEILESQMIIDSQLYQAFNDKKLDMIQYSKNGEKYFTSYKDIGIEHVYLGIKVNKKSLFKPYVKNMQYSFMIAFILLIISIPIIFIAVNSIVKPIKDLILENQKIKNREFDKVEHIETSIIEFIELSSSFVSMSKSIQEYQKNQEEMLDAIIKLIAEAVDNKSPYTGGHCDRVPKIAKMLVDEANATTQGVFKDFKLESKEDLREFEIGTWLHDCGKVTTPEYVVDKATKLETINDRIHEVRTRFEVLWRDAQITYLESKLEGVENCNALELLNTTQEKLIQDFEFIANANIGGEYMSPEKQDRIKMIAQQEWLRHFDDSLGLGEVEILRYDKENAQTLPATEKLLSDKKQHIIKRENFDYEAYERDGFKGEVPEYLYNYGEVYNLCIDRGTLSPEERYKINEHVIMTIKMLEKIPFPSHMTRIPEYAGTHHETLIGTGYPRKLSEDELSIPARIMALADVFEALTASDRPYKKAKTLSVSVKILSSMVKKKHLDEDVFKLFLQSGLYTVYAKKYLKEEQIDEVDIEQYL